MNSWQINSMLTMPFYRLVAVSAPIGVLRLWQDFTKGAIPILTWGGLRGGISVALALSLPDSPARDVLLVACYIVVIFSIVAQGLTIGPLTKRLLTPSPEDADGSQP